MRAIYLQDIDLGIEKWYQSHVPHIFPGGRSGVIYSGANNDRDSFSCSENKSKIIFMARLYVVCDLMEANEKIPVKCFNESEAWELFQSEMGVICSDPKIQPLAEVVANECDGLPVASTMIGITMASKKDCYRVKKCTLNAPETFPRFYRHERQSIFNSQFNYDGLANNPVRSCFLFCSLYPEDFNINSEKVVREWMGKGYTNEFNEWEEAVNMGHDLIEVLKSSCLLESGKGDKTVKMHDAIHDMAHWIACECGRENDRILVTGDDGISVNHKT